MRNVRALVNSLREQGERRGLCGRDCSSFFAARLIIPVFSYSPDAWTF